MMKLLTERQKYISLEGSCYRQTEWEDLHRILIQSLK